MKQLKPIELKFLEIVFEGNKELSTFTVFKRLRVSFPIFTKTLSCLLEKKLIESNHELITLTKAGFELVSFGAGKSKLKYKPWRCPAPEMLQPQISLEQPYIPSRDLLDDRYFKK